MERLELKAVPRIREGKGKLKRMRAEGMIPGVVYGHKQPPLAVAVNGGELKQVINRGGSNVFIDLLIKENGKEAQDTVMLKEIQRDPIKKDHFLHVDLIRVSLTDEVEVNVSLNLVGEPQGVKEGGVLQVQMREVMVKSLPADIPERLSINIEGLSIGDSLHVRDIALPPGVEILEDPEEVIVSVLAPTLVEEEEEAAAEEEGEGEAAEVEAAPGEEEEENA